MSSLDLAARLQPILSVPDTWSGHQALTALQKSTAAMALVEIEARPQALLSEHDLAEVGAAHISERLVQLPGLIFVDAAAGVLDIDDLVVLAYHLTRTGASGFVVLLEGKVAGWVPSEEVDAALPIDAIGSSRVSGNPGVRPRWYVCHKCRPAPSRRAPFDATEAPSCPRNWLHGRMEPEA